MSKPHAVTSWLAVLVAVVALACGLSACGDSGDEPATESATSTADSPGQPADSAGKRPKADGQPKGDPSRGDRAPSRPPPANGDADDQSPSATSDGGQVSETVEKRRVAAVVEGMYRDMATGDAAGVCSAMSRAAHAQIARQFPGGTSTPQAKRTCVSSLAAFLGAATSSGVTDRTANARVAAVDLEGEHATATVSFSGATGRLKLTKEDGDWRLGPGSIGP